jgi:DNA-binding CsgD family transcriptional regulator
VGKLEEADRDIAEWLELATARGRRSVLARLARPRAALAQARGNGDLAHSLLADGVEHAMAGCGPFDQALLHDAMGRLLRRQGHRRRACGHLQAALAGYEELGATPFHQRCATELAGSGLNPGRRVTATGTTQPRLTAREQAVAALAANGLTNREIAAALVISVKTVEHHLGTVFAKLAVSNRTQLVNAISGFQQPAPGPLP